LWGAARPARQPRGRLLLGYGLASWLYSLAFLALMLAGFYHFLGAGCAALLGVMTVPSMFRGLGGGEIRKMIRLRHPRTAVWALLPGAAAAALYLGRMEDQAGGPFLVRPAVRAELRAPVAGFLRCAYYDEGDRVSPGAVVCQLEVPELDSRLAQK